MSAPELRQAENGVWYIHWTEGRRSRRESTRSKELAQAQVVFAHWLLIEQTAKDTPAATLTCRSAWGLYADEVVAKSADPGRAKAAWKNLEVHFAELALNRVTQDVVDEYSRKRELGLIGRGAKLSTVWLELAKLVASWNHAAERRPPAISKSEVPKIDLPDPPEPRDRWLRDDEISRLFDAAAAARTGEKHGQISGCGGDELLLGGSGSRSGDPHLRYRLTRVERFLWLALETAARRSAIEALTWKQVDFETRVIHYLPDGARQTSKKKASVPISDALLVVLRRAYDERTGPYVLDGTTWIYDHLARVARAAGVEGLTPHVLRHTAATIMARKGVDLWIIAGILGNTVAMVEKVYAKHNPDHGRDAVNQISGDRMRRAVG
jgi:integrase